MRLQAMQDAPIYLQKNRSLFDHTPAGILGMATVHDFPWHLGPADYRSVMENELVFECDWADYGDLMALSGMVRDYLDVQQIPHIFSYSGGRGYHDQLWFDVNGLEQIVGWQTIRVVLFHYILNQVGIPISMRQEGYGMDPTSVAWTKMHLLREIGGFKFSFKTPISGIPFERPNTVIKDVRFPRRPPIWKVPESLLRRLFQRGVKAGADRIFFENKHVLPSCVDCPIRIPRKYLPVGASMTWLGCRVCGGT